MQLIRLTGKTVLFVLAVTLAVVPGLASAQEIRLIDVPGATHTLALDINEGGDIVGRYITADKKTHAFVLRDGDFTTIDVDGATTTTANGINARGDIVERYVAAASNGVLILSGGTQTAIDIPGATFVGGARNNNRGEVAGVYTLADGIRHGFVYDGTTIATVDVPGSVGTQAFTVSEAGEVLGHFLSPDGKSHAFIRDKKGQFSSIDVPGATATGSISGVLGRNARGETVGYYTGADKHNHAYHLYDGEYMSFDVDGATDTCFFGINNHGDIVGFYQDPTGAMHGILLKGGL